MAVDVMLSCRIPEPLRVRLKVEAAERGVTMAELVKRAIEELLAANAR